MVEDAVDGAAGASEVGAEVELVSSEVELDEEEEEGVGVTDLEDWLVDDVRVVALLPLDDVEVELGDGRAVG